MSAGQTTSAAASAAAMLHSQARQEKPAPRAARRRPTPVTSAPSGNPPRNPVHATARRNGNPDAARSFPSRKYSGEIVAVT
ncbi:uncharacterized protein SOCE26_026460 [Sorangium cellulosum]|uniref:Uncharacterized protein n=1 Tax=Sorangium cellulosum TaxID=56 RepID=A0A2L0EPM2_SORCE|nr:uncharacterized protein SOCE26_026460 [Sorangium cellulosum]